MMIAKCCRDAAALEKFIAEKLGHEVPEEKPAAPESAEVTSHSTCPKIAVPCFPVVNNMFRPWLRQDYTSSPVPLSPPQLPKGTLLSSSMLPGNYLN